MQVPANFEYARASSVDDALALLARYGPDARVIAGGHSLLPMMKLRLAQPEALIDLNDLTELDYIKIDGNELAIGAMTRHRSVLESALVREHFTILTDAERVIADPIVRNRGTVGGSLCQADPSEDLSAAFSAVHATCVIKNNSGVRTVAAREFHEGPYETVVRDGELLLEVRLPIRPGGGSAYEKVERRVGDWAVAASGVAVWLERRHDQRRRHRPHGRRRRALRRHRGRELPARQRRDGGELRRGRPPRVRELLAVRRPARPGRLQASPRR